MHLFSRRNALQLLTFPVARLLAQQVSGDINQGMATRGVKPQPRRKPSGIPFHAHLTDVAPQAGLKAVTIDGHLKRADYIIEAMGCG